MTKAEFEKRCPLSRLVIVAVFAISTACFVAANEPPKWFAFAAALVIVNLIRDWWSITPPTANT
jgi:hypothetical protein